MNNELNANALKTFLVRFVTTTTSVFDPAGWRDDSYIGLVHAHSLPEAEEITFRSHCPEAYVEDAVEERMSNDKPENLTDKDGNEHTGIYGRNRGVDWYGYRAFQLGDHAGEVDQGCVFWIKSVIEIPEADALVMAKYLVVYEAEIYQEVALLKTEVQADRPSPPTTTWELTQED